METRCKTCGIVNCEGHETFADEIEEKLFEAKQRDRGPWFTTNSGIHFYIMDPHSDEIRIKDIATHLSVLTRFGGALGVHYSVGHHSIIMADIAQLRGMEPVDQFICLMHDAAEAYIGDVVHPFKIMLPMVKECEDRILRVMGDKYGVRLHDLEHVFKDMDRQLCKAEAEMYGMDTNGWTDPDYVNAGELYPKEQRLLEAVSKWDHFTVRDHFENMFYELFGEVFVI